MLDYIFIGSDNTVNLWLPGIGCNGDLHILRNLLQYICVFNMHDGPRGNPENKYRTKTLQGDFAGSVGCHRFGK